jgi:glycosyltransferase involved in cell wall biosynthesis
MHIIFATQVRLYRNRGETVHVTELARELVRHGVKVSLIASGKPQYPIQEVEMIDAGRISNGRFFMKLITFVALTIRGLYHVLRLSRQADVLYTRDALLGSCLVLLSPLIRLPLVFEVNGFRGTEKKMESPSLGTRLLSWILDRAEKMSFRGTRLFICVTEGIRETLAKEYGIPLSRMEVVNNGVNLQLYSPHEETEQQEHLRKSLGLHSDDAIVLYLGSLQPWQDLPTVLEAVGQLQIQNRSPVLLIVGGGDQQSQLEEQAKQLPNQARVVFVGYVPYREVPPYICLANVCVMPFTKKRNEKIGLSPIKLYSYLACGKPVVASKIRGLEFLEENGLGSLVPCKDSKAFASALTHWLEKPYLLEEISLKARRYAQDNCGWEKTAISVAQACQRVARTDIRQSP